MTRIDFYILSQQEENARQSFACKLVERAMQSDHNVLIYHQNEIYARKLDDFLWHYKPEAFLPHSLVLPATPPTKDRVQLSWHSQVGNHHDVLINLADEVPGFFSRFERVLEIVVQHEYVLQKTREHYKFYRHRGFPIKDNDLRI